MHYLDFGGPAGGPLIVGVHGLGGTAVNWSAVAPLLTGRYRLLAPDLSGHGLTWSAQRGSGVRAQRVLLDGFLAAVAAGPVVLMGNSMGGMISLLEAAAAPKAVAGLILIDPVLPVVLARPDPMVAGLLAWAAVPGLGRLMSRRRLPPEAIVTAALALCCADPARVAAEDVARHVYVTRQRMEIAGADRDFLSATRSVAATLFPGRSRAYRGAVNSVSCPLLLVHGDRDRLVPVRLARAAARANPAWSVTILPGIGHVPMLEAPHETAGLIIQWMESARLLGPKVLPDREGAGRAGQARDRADAGPGGPSRDGDEPDGPQAPGGGLRRLLPHLGRIAGRARKGPSARGLSC